MITINLLRNIDKDIKDRFGNEAKQIYEILALYNSKPICIYNEAQYDDRLRYTIRIITNENEILSYNRIGIAYNPNTTMITYIAIRG